jgi:hypothetical protein
MNLENFIKEIEEIGFEQIKGCLDFCREDMYYFKYVTIRIHPELSVVYILGRLYLNGIEYNEVKTFSFFELGMILEQLRMNIKEYIPFLCRQLSRELLYDIIN